jgi:hypothetical protein
VRVRVSWELEGIPWETGRDAKKIKLDDGMHGKSRVGE